MREGEVTIVRLARKIGAGLLSFLLFVLIPRFWSEPRSLEVLFFFYTN